MLGSSGVIEADDHLQLGRQQGRTMPAPQIKPHPQRQILVSYSVKEPGGEMRTGGILLQFNLGSLKWSNVLRRVGSDRHRRHQLGTGTGPVWSAKPPSHLHERLEFLQLHGVGLLCSLRHSWLLFSGHLRSVKPHKAVSCNSVRRESDTISRADDSRTTWRITSWIILKTPQSRTQPISRSIRNHGTGHTITFVFAV